MKCPKIIHNSVLPNVYPSSQWLYYKLLLYCNQCAVMWCSRSTGIKGFSTSFLFFKRCLPMEIKPQECPRILKLLPKSLSTNNCELTRPWHPKQTFAAQTRLAVSSPKLTPTQFSNWLLYALTWLISVGGHAYCQHRIKER